MDCRIDRVAMGGLASKHTGSGSNHAGLDLNDARFVSNRADLV
jgi:hypothetical protein